MHEPIRDVEGQPIRTHEVVECTNEDCGAVYNVWGNMEHGVFCPYEPREYYFCVECEEAIG